MTSRDSWTQATVYWLPKGRHRGRLLRINGVKYIVMGGNIISVSEYTMQYTSDVLQNCTLITYIILLSNVMYTMLKSFSCSLEKNVFQCVWVLHISVRSSWFIVLVKSSVPLFILFLIVVYTIENGILRSPTLIVELFTLLSSCQFLYMCLQWFLLFTG